MVGSLSWIDILFLITIVLLVFNGFRNGFVFSLFNLISIPAAVIVAFLFGPQFTALLAANNIPATPIISYIVLFFGTVFVLHIIGTVLRGVVRSIPLIGCIDAPLGGLIGFIEAWLLWVIVLVILGSFLQDAQSAVQHGNQIVPGFNISIPQLQSWHDIYNQTVSHSLFAQVNSFLVKTLPPLPSIR